MKIDRATPAEIRAVALAMRKRDLAEFSAVSRADTREELAVVLAERYAHRDDVLCVSTDDGTPVCIGATLELRPNVMSLLFFATDSFGAVAFPLTRFVRQNLFPRYEAIGVHRFEAVSMADHGPAHRWLRALGLQPETGPLLNYGKRGEAFIQFVKVCDVRQAGSGE